MFSVSQCPLPDNALLGRYAGGGNYTDCFMIEFPGTVAHAAYVEAFLTTPLFRLERSVLKWLLAKPSTDDDARRLVAGESDDFAAWSVEERSADQTLLCDYLQRTRTWLMTVPVDKNGDTKTRLYFGSAVVVAKNNSGQERALGAVFELSRGLHKVYSAALLRAASENIKRLNL